MTTDRVFGTAADMRRFAELLEAGDSPELTAARAEQDQRCAALQARYPGRDLAELHGRIFFDVAERYPRSWRVRRAPGTLSNVKPRAGVRWYRITNRADVAEVMIYDEVGYLAVTAADFLRELNAVTAQRINLRLNSPGGEIFDGFAIYEALRRHPATITTYVDGLAASIASVIAMAGDRVIVAKNARLMIHEASGLTIGNADDHQQMAVLLDSLSGTIAEIYAERAGGTAAKWRKAMKAETWYSANEAVTAGLAHEVEAIGSGRSWTPDEFDGDAMVAALRSGVIAAKLTHTVQDAVRKGREGRTR